MNISLFHFHLQKPLPLKLFLLYVMRKLIGSFIIATGLIAKINKTEVTRGLNSHSATALQTK